MLLAVLHSCDIDSRHEFECLNTNPHNVTIEDALENHNSALDLINGGTKSPISAEIANVRLITPFDLPLDTKSQSGQNDFEQLVYVVDFEDEQGFAVLGADDRFVPVLVITEQGSSPKNIVDPPSLDPGTTSPDGLTLDQLYCEEDDEYYLGGNEDMVGTLISDYIVKTMNGGVNPLNNVLIMKKFYLIVVLVILGQMTALAQYRTGGEGELHYRNGALYTSDNVKVSSSAAMSYMSQEDYEQYFQKGSRLFKSGIIVSSVGAGIIAATVLFDVIYSQVTYDPSLAELNLGYIPVASILGASVGGALLLASVPLYWVGTVKLKKAATLSFAPPSGGVGLAVRF